MVSLDLIVGSLELNLFYLLDRELNPMPVDYSRADSILTCLLTSMTLLFYKGSF